MRFENDTSDTAYFRGYEWWLMDESKSRNSEIKFSGLEWGVPGWIIENGSIFSEKNIQYIINWIKGAKKYHNISIDTIGVGYNEGNYDITWIKKIKKNLTDNGLENIKTIAADDCCGRQYKILSDMEKDPELASAIDIIGTHCPGTING